MTTVVDTTAYPFNAGAIFDPATSTFIWTPDYEDEGKTTVLFFVSDGVNDPQTLKVKIKVKAEGYF